MFLPKLVNMFIVFFLIIHLITHLDAVPQVFNETYSFCRHEFSNGKNLTYPNKLWSIRTRDFTLHFSFCQLPNRHCDYQTSSCLVKSDNHEIIDLGNTFKPVDTDDIILMSMGSIKCDANKNYTMNVHFQCSDTIKSKPLLMPFDDENECTFEVTMMRPDCRPKCTELIDGIYLIDIRNFPKEMLVESDSKNFSLSLCGLNKKCSSREVSSCEFGDTNSTPLVHIDSQYLNYDKSKNELTARGRYKEGRITRDIQVLIKCNWQTGQSQAIYKKVPFQGRHYKFEVESSYGCVKLPQDCSVTNIGNLKYNLSDIYNTNGWLVSGVPEGTIILNICGPLPQPQGICLEQYSQVCHNNNDNYINRGSILSSLIAHESHIKAVFSSGSTCVENTQLLYSTEIEFRCSLSEKGPVFKEYKGCVMFVIWESPHACPVNYYEGQNCYMSDQYGNRNLQKLFSETDKFYPLSPDNKVHLIYNLCGPIHANCNNFNNVSFCLKTGETDLIIGYDQRKVVSNKGLLSMELTGNSCLNKQSEGKVTINFICSYDNPSPPPEIKVLEDNCKFEIKIFTFHACLSDGNFEDCVYSDGENFYDLSSLSSRNSNFIINDVNIEYILNVCGPVITGPGAFCRGNTMTCLRNKTELNIKHEYMSLGGVSKPKFKNNSLFIEANMGGYCEGLGYYRTIIYFECSVENFPPQFLSQEQCTYKFMWKTPEACPKKEPCMVTSPKTHTHTITIEH